MGLRKRSSKSIFLKVLMPLLLVFSACSTTTKERQGNNSLRLAVVEYPIEGNRKLQQLLQKIEGFVMQAKNENADMVLFPEWIALDLWPLESEAPSREIVDEISNNVARKLVQKLKDLATTLSSQIFHFV